MRPRGWSVTRQGRASRSSTSQPLATELDSYDDFSASNIVATLDGDTGAVDVSSASIVAGRTYGLTITGVADGETVERSATVVAGALDTAATVATALAAALDSDIAFGASAASGVITVTSTSVSGLAGEVGENVVTISSGAGDWTITQLDDVSSAGRIALTSSTGEIRRAVGSGDVNLVADRLELNADKGLDALVVGRT